jgi:hypothetical protein
MGPPWWAWLLGILGAIALGAWRAVARFRRGGVEEIIADLARLRPDVTVLRFDGGSLAQEAWVAVRMPSGAEATVSLQELLSELLSPQGRIPANRAAILERWAKARFSP